MGHIEQQMVKRTTKELMKRDILFSENFNDDKKILGSTMPSKKVRNKIAGYIARLKKMERVSKEAEALKASQIQLQIEQ